MKLGDLIEVYFVRTSCYGLDECSEFMSAGLLIDIAPGLDSRTKTITCLNTTGEVETIEVGHRRGEYYFNVDVINS